MYLLISNMSAHALVPFLILHLQPMTIDHVVAAWFRVLRGRSNVPMTEFLAAGKVNRMTCP